MSITPRFNFFRKMVVALAVFNMTFASLAPLTAQAATPAGERKARKQAKKLSPELEAASASAALVRVILQTKGRPSAAHDAAISSKGGKKRAALEALDAVVAEVPANAVASLAAREDVAYISPDRPVKAQMSLVRETTGTTIVQSNEKKASEFTGKGVTIAFIDSGISSTHPDFAEKNRSRLLASVDFTSSLRTGDAYGHGTGVASVAAGSGIASRGYAGDYAGIAPEANIVDLRALNENGVGYTSAILNALNWAIANKQRYDIRIVNISAGAPIVESHKTDPLCQAVKRAYAAGIVVVCSAGNYGSTNKVVGYDSTGKEIHQSVYGTITSPGNSPYAITVGATDTRSSVKRSDDYVADFSSKGPTRFDHLVKPDLVAPGRRIMAALSQEPNPTFAQNLPGNVQQPVAGDAQANMYFK